jgi:hypothetical protein
VTNSAQEGLQAIDAMRMGVDYFFTVKVRDFKARLRPLTNGEIVQIYGDVAEQMLKVPPSRRTKMVEDQMMARNFLVHASSPFDNYAPTITDPILNAMTPDEMMAVYREWQAHCDRVNPALELMDNDQIKALVEMVKKNPPQDLVFQLTQLSFGQLVNLAHCLLTKGD